MDVPEGLAERASRLDILPSLCDPLPELFDPGRALALPADEAGFEVLAKALGLGVDVEERAEELEALRRARVAAAQREDEAAPRVRVATPSRPACALHAVVGRRAVAHHDPQRPSREQLVDVLRVTGGRVHEVRVAVIALDEPERAVAKPREKSPHSRYFRNSSLTYFGSGPSYDSRA